MPLECHQLDGADSCPLPVQSAQPRLGRRLSKPSWMDVYHEFLPVLTAKDVVITKAWEYVFEDDGDEKPSCGPCEFNVCGEPWRLDKFVGAGALGQTYLATYDRTGKRYAIKFLNDEGDPEFTFLQGVPYSLFRHKNLCTYVGLAKNLDTSMWPAPSMIFMEAIPNGELFHVINSEILLDDASPLDNGTIRRFVHDIISGMAELADHKISHRDLKPENLLINERGEVVIIDLGHAVDFHNIQRQQSCFAECFQGLKAFVSKNEERPSSPSASSSLPSSFFRNQTRARGTVGYRAPEASCWSCSYDAQRADVFTVGILTFMLHSPSMPFIDGFYDHGAEGFGEAWWSEHTPPEWPDDMKKFLNCLWRKDPRRRPIFQDLKAVISRKPEALKKWPELEWLAGELSDPLEFVRVLATRNANLSLKSAGVVEAFSAYTRRFRSRRAAFDAADEDRNERIAARELTHQLQATEPSLMAKVTEVDVAGLMTLHTQPGNSGDMTFEEFADMADVWDFGSQPIVYNCGRNRAHAISFHMKGHYSSMPRQSPRNQKGIRPRQDSAEESESMAFSEAVIAAFASLQSKTFHCEVQRQEHGAESSPNDQEGCYSFTATLISRRKEQLCQLRIQVFAANYKLVLESRIRWGSSIEEMRMLQEVQKKLRAEKWEVAQAPLRVSGLGESHKNMPIYTF